MFIALILIAVVIVILLALFIYMFIQWQRILDVERAIKHAWNNAEICDVEECNIIPQNQTWGLKSTEEFDAPTARTLIEFVGRLNMLTKPDAKPTSPDGYTLVKSFRQEEDEEATAFCAIWTSDMGMIIAFRATTTDAEINQDLKLDQVAWKDMLVHSGFLEVYNTYMPVIDETIRARDPQHIFITGHSLGGAVATLMAINYGESRRVSGYVFGCPRIGNEQCDINIRLYAPGFWRVSNRSDLIAEMPPIVTPSFQQAGSKLYYYYPAGNEHSFNINWKSLRNNHFIPLYIEYLDTLL